MVETNEKIIDFKKPFYFVFDVDDTLTKPKTIIHDSMIEKIEILSKYFSISLVGGGTSNHISSQVKPINTKIEYLFCENGTNVYKNNELIGVKKITDEVKEEQLKILINALLKYLANLDLPFKRGTFIEFRNGLINVSPIGRNCELFERDLFVEFDKKNKVLFNLKTYIEELLIKENIELTVTYGGKISLDIFPKAWNKSLCLKYLDNKTSNIIFFGDKIYPGGNDYYIAVDERVIGYFQVENVHKTEEILQKIIEFVLEKSSNNNFKSKENEVFNKGLYEIFKELYIHINN